MNESERARIGANNQKYNERNRAYVKELKEATPCMDCGKFYPCYVMDFDHQRDKKFNIANMMQRASSFETLLTEIAKCEIVCANCHRERTHGQLVVAQLG